MNAKVAKCLLVSKVLVADGMMTDDERRFLETMMTALALHPEERRRVIDLEGWDEAEPTRRRVSGCGGEDGAEGGRALARGAPAADRAARRRRFLRRPALGQRARHD